MGMTRDDDDAPPLVLRLVPEEPGPLQHQCDCFRVSICTEMERKIFKWTRDYCERMAWKCKLKCPCLLLLAVKALMVNGKWEEEDENEFQWRSNFPSVKIALKGLPFVYRSWFECPVNLAWGQGIWKPIRAMMTKGDDEEEVEEANYHKFITVMIIIISGCGGKQSCSEKLTCLLYEQTCQSLLW